MSAAFSVSSDSRMRPASSDHLGSVGGHFVVEGFEDGFAAVQAELFDDVRQVGRVDLFQLGVRIFRRTRRCGSGSTMLPGSGIEWRNRALELADPERG
jgi:hypothetical protein